MPPPCRQDEEALAKLTEDEQELVGDMVAETVDWMDDEADEKTAKEVFMEKHVQLEKSLASPWESGGIWGPVSGAHTRRAGGD